MPNSNDIINQKKEILNKSLELLDIDQFIQQNKCLKVTSSAIFIDPKELKFHPEGIYSEVIFGRKGSKDRYNRFGYIEVDFIFIHPLALDILKSLLSTKVIDSILNGKSIYITQSGSIISESDIDEKTKVKETIENEEQLYNLFKELRALLFENKRPKKTLYEKVYDFYLNKDQATNLPWLFACGDIANRQADAISAIADGYRAVKGIEKLLLKKDS